MSVKMQLRYCGDFQTETVHAPSGNLLITDLPIDNGGQGRYFSPTDLFATSLASCIITIMAKVATRDGIELKDSTIEIEKVMADNPRRIAKLINKIKFAPSLTEKEKKKLLACVRACPVHQSLHPDVEVIFEEVS